MTPLPPLPPEIGELLEAERQRPGPPPTIRARILAALAAALVWPPEQDRAEHEPADLDPRGTAPVVP